MITINVTSTVAQLQAAIARTRNEQIPKVQEIALNWTATEIKNALVAEMAQVFDRPTPFTLNSLFIDPARRGRLEAHVYFKDFAPKGTAAGQYLKPQIEGGTRNLKRMEFQLRTAGLLPSGKFAVPAKEAPLDQYGNVERGFIVRMLSDLRAFGQSGYRANRKVGRRKGAKATNAFFVGGPTSPDPQARHLAPGIYWRLPNRVLVMVFVFTNSPGYRKRFNFYEVGQRVALEQYPIRYARAWQYVVTKGIA